jgi:hypothetical protein
VKCRCGGGSLRNFGRTHGHRFEGIWHSGSPMARIINLARYASGGKRRVHEAPRMGLKRISISILELKAMTQLPPESHTAPMQLILSDGFRFKLDISDAVCFIGTYSCPSFFLKIFEELELKLCFGASHVAYKCNVPRWFAKVRGEKEVRP